MRAVLKEQWSAGATLRFLLVASFLNRMGIRGNPRQLLRTVIVPLSLATWIILAITLAVLLPQWAQPIRRSFPRVEGLPGFTGEYYLLVFALVPVWFDSMTRVSAILFGTSSFQKMQVPTASLQLLGIDRKAYFWHVHQSVSWAKVAFVALPLGSVLVWTSRNIPTLSLGLVVLGGYFTLVALEALVTFRYISSAENSRASRPGPSLFKALAMIALGYLTARLLLAVLTSLNMGMPGETINPRLAAGLVALAQPGFSLTILALCFLAVLSVFLYMFRAASMQLGLYRPDRKYRVATQEGGIIFPVAGLQYFLRIFNARPALITFFCTGALWAMDGAVRVPDSLRSAVAIAVVSFIVSSTFEQTIALSFSRSRERYRFMYEVGIPLPELVVKIMVGVALSALPALLVALSVLLMSDTSIFDALIVVAGPTLGLVLSDSFLSTRVRAEGLRFTFLALAQVVVSLLCFSVTLLPVASTALIFLALAGVTVLAARKAILCMN